VSPDCTCETMLAAQKFTRHAMGSENIDSSVRQQLGGGLGLWTRLFGQPISLKNIKKSSRLLVAGLDPRFAMSVVGWLVHQARSAGAKLAVLDPEQTALARSADHWYPDYSVGSFDQALSDLSGSGPLSVIVGPGVFGSGGCSDELRDKLLDLAGSDEVNLVPLYPGANTRGAFEMGVLTELMPGAKASEANSAVTSTELLAGNAKPKVLYLVGDVPFSERPACDTLIVQNLFSPDFDVDVFLPAASFAEAGGTLINVEGRARQISPVEQPDADGPHPDAWILSKLADSMSKSLGYDTLESLRKELEATTKLGSEPRKFAAPEVLPLSTQQAQPAGADPQPSALGPPGLYSYRSVPLSTKVEGLAELEARMRKS
jgi:predicted molibdopterin-dependent oxidoreductase YjgC